MYYIFYLIKDVFIIKCICYILNMLYPGPDPEMLLPGGTESRSLEPSVESRERGEYERGLNPLSLGGSGARNFF